MYLGDKYGISAAKLSLTVCSVQAIGNWQSPCQGKASSVLRSKLVHLHFKCALQMQCVTVDRRECRWQMCVQADHSLEVELLLGNAPDPLQLVRKMQPGLNRQQLFITAEQVSEQLLHLQQQDVMKSNTIVRHEKERVVDSNSNSKEDKK